VWYPPPSGAGCRWCPRRRGQALGAPLFQPLRTKTLRRKTRHSGKPGLLLTISDELSSLAWFCTADKRRDMSNLLGNHAEGFRLKRLTKTGAGNSTFRHVRLQRTSFETKLHVNTQLRTHSNVLAMGSVETWRALASIATDQVVEWAA
jgi:hypothetical protein